MDERGLDQALLREEEQVTSMSHTAVVRIQETQFRVHENEVLRVPKLAAEVGDSVVFDQVLLLGGDEVKVGTPLVDGASVTAEVVEQGRAKKVIVFKMKRRKGYRRKAGHRQGYTSIRVTAIQA